MIIEDFLQKELDLSKKLEKLRESNVTELKEQLIEEKEFSQKANAELHAEINRLEEKLKEDTAQHEKTLGDLIRQHRDEQEQEATDQLKKIDDIQKNLSAEYDELQRAHSHDKEQMNLVYKRTIE
eukprot:Tbor_TRINITY_DN7863_c0_g1::TRINITY_DN7863_c0_g1_i1::g.23662::m.23662